MKVIRVSRKLFSSCRSIQKAILQAEPGCRIEVEPGIYREDIYIDKYIEIVGIGDRETIIIQGIERPTLSMVAGYAVVKNLSLKQPRKRTIDTVSIPNGALILEDCHIFAKHGVGIYIMGKETEPILRRCRIHSERNAAVEIEAQGHVIMDDCELHTGDFASLIIREGNPTIRRCTITGLTGYGIYIEDAGQGYFEECNIYGLDYSPAIGILRGNPTFVRCQIHDCNESGVVIDKGSGRFQACRFYGFGKELPAVRLTNQSQSRFERCQFHHCQGGALWIEKQASTWFEDCDLSGFTHEAAIQIQSEAQAQFVRCRIHDGNAEAVVCTDHGKGMLESCQIYSFNGHLVSIHGLSQLDVLRCQLKRGSSHGLMVAQKSKGVIQESVWEQFPLGAAIAVTQAADPQVIGCQIKQCRVGVEVTENGRGTFQECIFQSIEESTWVLDQGDPVIRDCKEETTREHSQPLRVSQHPPPLNVGPTLQKWLVQLDSIIGQALVKKELQEFIMYLDYLQDRKAMGIKTTESPPLHALFLGPEQTGKLEVAEIYARFLVELRYLASAKLTRISLSTYINQEGRIDHQKLTLDLQQASGCVIYIDRIPRLQVELVDQLLEQVRTVSEHPNERQVLIFSMGPSLGQQWMNQHPLSFLRVYHFHEYAPEEMQDVFIQLAEQEDYTIHIRAREPLTKAMIRLWKQESSTSHVQRVVDYFQQVKVDHSLRCAQLPKKQRTKEVLTTIMPEDFPIRSEKGILPSDQDWVDQIRKK